MTFGERLTELRKEHGFNTRNEFAEKLGIPSTTLRNYETDVREPGHLFLKQISEMFNVSVDYLLCLTDNKEVLNSFRLNEKEYTHIEKYRQLSVYDKETVDMTIDRLINKPAPSDDSGSAETIRIYPYLHNVASAGAGDYIADIPLDSIEAPYIKNADFVIGVCGDSMEPDFHSGEKLYVQKTDVLNTGDIGIFKKDGSLFLKEAGTDRLISHNGDYPDVYADSDDISVVGKVLGKLK